MIDTLATALMMSTPLLYGAISEMFTERSGVMNTSIEGAFLMGAFGGFVGAYISGSLLIGFIFAIISGVLLTFIYGIVTVKYKQHQVVTGTALNILALGLATFLFRVIFGIPVIPLKVTPLQTIAIPLLSKIPFVGPIFFDQNLLTYIMYFIVPASFYVLYKTSYGLIIRSTGENPEAVDVAGVDVNRVRITMLLIAGAFCGIAGAFYSLTILGLFTSSIIGGRGWIAFAICFLGNWRPYGVLFGALAFGLAEAIGIRFMVMEGMVIPNEFFIALPYILTIILTITRNSFNIPAKLGVPYNKE
ncbi:ABC transporter permease [Mycoplasmatota bacterium]|nr:ABC transporter permease [Mycoplasmatota bacterium]